MSRLCFAVVSLSLLLWVASANAGIVALVQPHSSTPDVTETLTRLHGELLSVGLEVKMILSPTDRSPDRATARAWVEKLAAEGGIDAVIEVAGEDTPIWVDVWVIEKSPHRLELSRVASDPNAANASERLAIRAIEVLRSSFLESDMSNASSHQVSTTKSVPVVKPRREPNQVVTHPERIGIGGGVAVLTSLDGLGPAVLPTARLDWALQSWLMVHGELAGFGSRPAIANSAGHARVAQQYGFVGGSYRLRSDQGLSPFLTLSLGALHTSAVGESGAQSIGHTEMQWSFLVDASVGAALRLPGRFYLTLAGHVQLAEPYVAIHLADAIVATSGRPNLALTLIVGAWL